MKKIIIHIAFILAIISPINAQNFIGVISFETENFEIGETAKITCYLKPPYCKMEISSSSKEGNTSYTLYFNDQSSDMVMVSSGTKTTVPVSTMKVNKYVENILVAIPTNKTENIAGYSAKEISLKSTNAIIQCFVADELNIKFPIALNTFGINKALAENSIQGTAVQIIAKDLSGKPVFSQKITAISPQALNDGIFVAE